MKGGVYGGEEREDERCTRGRVDVGWGPDRMKEELGWNRCGKKVGWMEDKGVVG